MTGLFWILHFPTFNLPDCPVIPLLRCASLPRRIGNGMATTTSARFLTS